jgi:hypothetical protein
MKFNPDRDDTPFQYKGYEVRLRRPEAVEGIEIRLIKRADNPRNSMLIAFVIPNRRNLFPLLRKAIAALKRAEVI